MLRATFSGMRQRKLRLVLSGLAVVLGVMFVAGSLVLTDTLGRSFDRVFAEAYEHTDVLVQGVPNVAVHESEGEQVPAKIPAGTVDVVAAVPGVAEATGVVEADGARVIGADGQVVASFGPPRFGANWTGEDELVELREGRGPAAPDEIAVNASLAEAAGVAVGDRVGVLTLEPRRDFTLVGIFGFSGGRDTIGGVQYVAFTDEIAQQLMLGEPDVWTGVDVRVADGHSPAQVRDELAAVLGDDYHVRTGEELAQEQASEFREALGFIGNILLGFAAVALFVGVFLILNTFSIVVAQRLRELALVRAIGASRRQILSSVLIEALMIGLVASALGLGAGIGVAALLAWLAARYQSLPLAGVGVPASAVVAAFAVGLAVTAVAALLPAWRASRVPPIAAMQQAATPDRPLTRLSITGGLVMAAGAALLAFGLVDGTLWMVLLGVLGSLVGVALLTPLVARPVVSLLGRLFAWSVPGKLGRLNSGRNPRRTAITAAALMVGVALISGVGVILDSAKASLSDLARDTISAQLVISGEQTGPRPPTFDPDVLDAAGALPGVTAAVGTYREIALVDGDRVFLSAANDLAALRDVFGLETVDGTLDTLQPGQIVVHDSGADERDLQVGDRVQVQLSHGQATTYEVAGIYRATPLYTGFILPAGAVADFGVPQPVMGFIALADGADLPPVRDELAALLADSPEVSITDQSAFIEQQAGQLDFVLTLIRVLLALAVLIAVLGVVNTLVLSVIERTRELGLLRAVGLGRGATMRMVTVESMVISLFGALQGVAVGAVLGAAVVWALRDDGINQLVLPWTDMGVYVALAGLVGVVAAVLPAVRAARTDVLRAIAYE
jgi:putative ABC transport system permease protein